MKTKMINTLILAIGLSSIAFAGEPETSANSKILLKDNGTGEKCFNENTHIINIGIGIGGVYYSGLVYGTSRRSPAFSGSYEQPWPKKLGPGYLGVGAYLGYQNASYRYDYINSSYYYEHSWNYVMVAARGAYHWDILNSEKAEVYGGAMVGLRIQTYNYATNDPYENGNRLNDGSVYPIITAFAGARYYFAKKVAVYGEAGSGISYLTGGLSFKF